MAITHPVLGLEQDRLRLDPGDARDFGLAEEVVHGQRIELLRQQRRKGIAVGPRLDPDDFRVGVVAADLLVVADDFARRAVEVDELLVLALLVHHVQQARRFGPSGVLIDERARIVLLARSGRGAL